MNTSLLIDITLLLIAAMAIFRLFYIRFNREVFFRKHKYKPGTPEYERFTKLTCTSVLGSIVAGTVLVALKTTFDIHELVRAHGDSALGEIIFVIGFVVVIAVGVTLAMYRILKEDQ